MESQKIIKLFLALAILNPCRVSSAQTDKPNEKFVRVAIIRDADDAVVAAHGTFSIINLKNNETLMEGRYLKLSEVKGIKSEIHIGKNRFPTSRLRITSDKEVVIRIRNKDNRYRDNIDIFLDAKNRLTIVNDIELEKYVRGVLYHEVSNRFPMEAMKAQAVATRTYALYQIEQSKDLPFDVTSDIYSQVYGGRSAERYRTNLAVDKTLGQILVYNGKILPAYFHANSGGYTEDARELWEKIDLPPLYGVPSEFSIDMPAYSWKRNFRLSDIQDKLNANGYKLGLIKDIEVLERNKSGRIRNLKITARDGKSIVIKGKDFRNIIGPNEIRSNNYQIEMKGYFVDLIGKGWGHGVGMCQWGAKAMADKRYLYNGILKYYYPGAEIVDYRETKAEGL